jgi:sulfate transport system permease protein
VVTPVFGVVVALVLTRDRFPGSAIMSAIVDLPLAVSPVIVGLMAVILLRAGRVVRAVVHRSRASSIIFALPRWCWSRSSSASRS